MYGDEVDAAAYSFFSEIRPMFIPASDDNYLSEQELTNSFIVDYGVVNLQIESCFEESSHVELRIPTRSFNTMLRRLYGRDGLTINRVELDDWAVPVVGAVGEQRDKPGYMTYDQLFGKEEGDERSAKN